MNTCPPRSAPTAPSAFAASFFVSFPAHPSETELLATLSIDLDVVMACLDGGFGGEAYYYAARMCGSGRPNLPRPPGAGTPPRGCLKSSWAGEATEQQPGHG